MNIELIVKRVRIAASFIYLRSIVSTVAEQSKPFTYCFDALLGQKITSVGPCHVNTITITAVSANHSVRIYTVSNKNNTLDF